MRRYIHIFAGVMLLLASPIRAWSEQQREIPADFPDTFDELSAIIDQSEVSGMDMARGSYLATRFFSVGPDALPYVQTRFLQAKTRGEASMAGLYLSCWGKLQHLYLMRKDLETNRTKRVWVYELAGTEQVFFASLKSGEDWKSFTELFPSTSGPRSFAICCINSKDALVRRAGLYWGYWMQDKVYWQHAKALAQSDPDPVTRKIAVRLLLPSKPR